MDSNTRFEAGSSRIRRKEGSRWTVPYVEEEVWCKFQDFISFFGQTETNEIITPTTPGRNDSVLMNSLWLWSTGGQGYTNLCKLTDESTVMNHLWRRIHITQPAKKFQSLRKTNIYCTRWQDPTIGPIAATLYFPHPHILSYYDTI
jgi:hypothetical protein